MDAKEEVKRGNGDPKAVAKDAKVEDRAEAKDAKVEDRAEAKDARAEAKDAKVEDRRERKAQKATPPAEPPSPIDTGVMTTTSHPILGVLEKVTKGEDAAGDGRVGDGGTPTVETFSAAAE